jgi:hypothetical protein
MGSMTEQPTLSSFDQILQSVFQKIIDDKVLSLEQLSDASSDITKNFIVSAADTIRRDLKRKAPATLAGTRRETAGFEKRNLQRWRKAFNLIELIWEVAADVGDKFNKDLQGQPFARDQAYLLTALVHIHARSMLVASECICLMKGGFPDGALSRWRTLHELNVIAAFLLKNRSAAHRYIISFEIQALAAARQMQEYAARSKIEPPTEDKIASMEARCKSHVARFGKDIQDDYGWASEVIGKKKPNLLDLEKVVGLDHWRPRFKWASQHTHGAHRPFGSMLATTEATSPVFPIGQSNSGMVDPLHMTAISLTHVTSSLLMSRPSIDCAVCSKVLMGLSDDLGNAAMKVEHVKARK